MYEISVKTGFSGAHHLKDYKGACSELHGHNWEVEVFLRGNKTNNIGLVADFREVKKTIKDILMNLDHRDLNSLSAFSGTNPTSENIAKYLYNELAGKLDNQAYRVSKVRVSETNSTSASYWQE